MYMLISIVHLYMVLCYSECIINMAFELIVNLIGFSATFHDGTFTSRDDFC